MSLNRYSRKRDANEKEIINALRKEGVTVFQIDRPGDLLCRFLHLWTVLEVKPAKNAKWQKGQKELCDKHGIPVVTSPEEALRALGVI